MKKMLMFLCLALAVFGFAKDTDVVTASVQPDLISLEPTGDFAGFTLTVAAVDGTTYALHFDGDQIPFIDLVDDTGALLPDGLYSYQLTAAPHLSGEVREEMRRAREAGYAMKTVARDMNQSGFFTIKDGSFVLPESEGLFVAHKDDGGGSVGSGNGGTGGGTGGGVGDTQTGVATDADPDRAQVFVTDVVIQGSECVGFDCVNGENFGSDTQRLKENNLRIHFNDTSNSGSFPTADWRIVANDTTNGGANYLAFEDSDAGTYPFRVVQGAGNNALYVDAQGDVGLNTSNPVVELHVADGDSPTLRLEQTGSAGFTPQTWDLASNETNFFVRDVTNGSLLPFRIRPSAPTNSIYIDTDGDVGLGTNSPSAKLHVEGSGARFEGATTIEAAGAQLNITDTTGSTGNRFLLNLVNAGNTKLAFTNTAFNHTWEYVAGNNGQFYLFKQGETEHAMDVYGNGNVTIDGTLTQNSDVNAKENIQAVDTLEVLHSVLELPITTWNYKDTCDDVVHMGPMAQDFYSAFGLNGRNDGISSLDTTGAALGAIQGLNQKLQMEVEAKDAEIQDLRDQLASQEARLKALEAALLK